MYSHETEQDMMSSESILQASNLHICVNDAGLVPFAYCWSWQRVLSVSRFNKNGSQEVHIDATVVWVKEEQENISSLKEEHETMNDKNDNDAKSSSTMMNDVIALHSSLLVTDQ